MIPIFLTQVQDKDQTEQARPGVVTDSKRRSLLKASATLTGVLSAQSAIGLLAPSLSWALEVKHLKQDQANVTLALAKVLYPHKKLPDAVYALAVKDIDAYAADAENSKIVAAGVAALNAKANGKFAKAAAAKKHKIVEELIKTDAFIQKVRGTCITALYNNEMAFAHFGYQGEAFSKGGYIFRGFNDLTWLPNPPESASPPVVN